MNMTIKTNINSQKNFRLFFDVLEIVKNLNKDVFKFHNLYSNDRTAPKKKDHSKKNSLNKYIHYQYSITNYQLHLHLAH